MKDNRSNLHCVEDESHRRRSMELVAVVPNDMKRKHCLDHVGDEGWLVSRFEQQNDFGCDDVVMPKPLQV